MAEVATTTTTTEPTTTDAAAAESALRLVSAATAAATAEANEAAARERQARRTARRTGERPLFAARYQRLAQPLRMGSPGSADEAEALAWMTEEFSSDSDNDDNDADAALLSRWNRFEDFCRARGATEAEQFLERFQTAHSGSALPEKWDAGRRERYAAWKRAYQRQLKRQQQRK